MQEKTSLKNPATKSAKAKLDDYLTQRSMLKDPETVISLILDDVIENAMQEKKKLAQLHDKKIQDQTTSLQHKNTLPNINKNPTYLFGTQEEEDLQSIEIQEKSLKSEEDITLEMQEEELIEDKKRIMQWMFERLEKQSKEQSEQSLKLKNQLTSDIDQEANESFIKLLNREDRMNSPVLQPLNNIMNSRVLQPLNIKLWSYEVVLALQAIMTSNEQQQRTYLYTQLLGKLQHIYRDTTLGVEKLSQLQKEYLNHKIRCVESDAVEDRRFLDKLASDFGVVQSDIDQEPNNIQAKLRVGISEIEKLRKNLEQKKLSISQKIASIDDMKEQYNLAIGQFEKGFSSRDMEKTLESKSLQYQNYLKEFNSLKQRIQTQYISYKQRLAHSLMEEQFNELRERYDALPKSSLELMILKQEFRDLLFIIDNLNIPAIQTIATRCQETLCQIDNDLLIGRPKMSLQVHSLQCKVSNCLVAERMKNEEKVEKQEKEKVEKQKKWENIKKQYLKETKSTYQDNQGIKVYNIKHNNTFDFKQELRKYGIPFKEIRDQQSQGTTNDTEIRYQPGIRNNQFIVNEKKVIEEIDLNKKQITKKLDKSKIQPQSDITNQPDGIIPKKHKEWIAWRRRSLLMRSETAEDFSQIL